MVRLVYLTMYANCNGLCTNLLLNNVLYMQNLN